MFSDFLTFARSRCEAMPVLTRRTERFIVSLYRRPHSDLLRKHLLKSTAVPAGVARSPLGYFFQKMPILKEGADLASEHD